MAGRNVLSKKTVHWLEKEWAELEEISWSLYDRIDEVKEDAKHEIKSIQQGMAEIEKKKQSIAKELHKRD